MNRLRQVWSDIKQRCQNPNNRNYCRYGARGITVCREWSDSFIPFYEWATSVGGYKPGLSIERLDNEGPYAPYNCTFANRHTQSRNKRTNVLVTAFGETKCLMDWASDPRCGIGLEGLRQRLLRGMNPEEAIAANSLNDGTKEFCRNGHQFSEDNTQYEGKYRRCKICRSNRKH